jgi:hypothetical protein
MRYQVLLAMVAVALVGTGCASPQEASVAASPPASASATATRSSQPASAEPSPWTTADDYDAEEEQYLRDDRPDDLRAYQIPDGEGKWSADRAVVPDPDIESKVANLLWLSRDHDSKVKLVMDAIIEDGTLAPEGKGGDYPLVLTVDPVEPTNYGDPSKPFFWNKSTATKQIKLSEDVIILTDPHNGFGAVRVGDLLKHLKSFAGDKSEGYEGNPFAFYSVDGEYVALVQWMLP